MSIKVGPSSVTLLKGATQQLVATATYDDGTTEVVTTWATWTSLDPNVALVGQTGSVSGAEAGVTTIVATLGLVAGRVSVEVTADVTAPTETSD